MKVYFFTTLALLQRGHVGSGRFLVHIYYNYGPIGRYKHRNNENNSTLKFHVWPPSELLKAKSEFIWAQSAFLSTSQNVSNGV
jgi:hypothetical protein